MALRTIPATYLPEKRLIGYIAMDPEDSLYRIIIPGDLSYNIQYRFMSFPSKRTLAMNVYPSYRLEIRIQRAEPRRKRAEKPQPLTIELDEVDETGTLVKDLAQFDYDLPVAYVNIIRIDIIQITSNPEVLPIFDVELGPVMLCESEIRKPMLHQVGFKIPIKNQLAITVNPFYRFLIQSKLLEIPHRVYQEVSAALYMMCTEEAVRGPIYVCTARCESPHWLVMRIPSLDVLRMPFVLSFLIVFRRRLFDRNENSETTLKLLGVHVEPLFEGALRIHQFQPVDLMSPPHCNFSINLHQLCTHVIQMEPYYHLSLYSDLLEQNQNSFLLTVEIFPQSELRVGLEYQRLVQIHPLCYDRILLHPMYKCYMLIKPYAPNCYLLKHVYRIDIEMQASYKLGNRFLPLFHMGENPITAYNQIGIQIQQINPQGNSLQMVYQIRAPQSAIDNSEIPTEPIYEISVQIDLAYIVKIEFGPYYKNEVRMQGLYRLEIRFLEVADPEIARASIPLYHQGIRIDPFFQIVLVFEESYQLTFRAEQYYHVGIPIETLYQVDVKIEQLAKPVTKLQITNGQLSMTTRTY